MQKNVSPISSAPQAILALCALGASIACEAHLTGRESSVNVDVYDPPTVGEEGQGGEGPTSEFDRPDEPLTCGKPQQLLGGTSSDHLVRLSRDELGRTLEALLGSPVYADAEIADRIAGLPPDVLHSASDFSSDPPKSLPSILARVAERAASLVVNDDDWRERYLPCDDDAIDRACVDHFIRRFGANVERRALSEDAVERAYDFYAEAGEGMAGVQLSVRRFLMSPSLVFHLEIGAEATDDGRIRLTADEVASRLAYASTGAPPDAPLIEAAESGELETVEQARAHALRLLDTPLGKEKLRDFFRYYTHTAEVPDPSPPIADLAGVTDVRGLGDEMRLELFAFVDDVLDSGGGFKDLMTSPRAFPRSAALARVLGADEAPNEGALTAPQHPGLLHRPALLQSTGQRTNLIARGAHVRKFYLCDELGVPASALISQGLEALESTRDLPNRAAVDQATAAGPCAECHALINPLGALFESYDQLGAYREEEVLLQANGRAQTFPIDTAVSSPLLEQDGPSALANSRALVNALGSSQKARLCLGQRTLEYYRKRPITQDRDACALRPPEMSDPSTSLKELFASLLSGDDIFYRKDPDAD